jgi:hypothetical protein
MFHPTQGPLPARSSLLYHQAMAGCKAGPRIFWRGSAGQLRHGLGRLGGQTASKGWLEIANPSSTKMSIHAFNIDNWGIKSSGSSGDTKEASEFLKVSKFTVALGNIMLDTRCATAISAAWTSRQPSSRGSATTSSRRTRKSGGTRRSSCDLVNTWRAFFSALPQSQLAKPIQDNK